MTRLKVATFNLEWMVLAFGGKWTDWVAPQIPTSFPGGKVGGAQHGPIADVHDMCRRIAGVIKDMKAKIVGYQEGPPLKEQMEAFVDQFLDGKYVVFHSNSRWQSVGALVHHTIASRVTAWTLHGGANRWKDIPYYPWGKIAAADQREHDFDRHPLLIQLKVSSKRVLRLMVVHTKSKYSKLKSVKQWNDREPEAVLDALEARAKLSAEAFRLREVIVEELTASGALPSLLMMGDFNDGPYAEKLESEFLFHNIVDELVGSLLYPDVELRHAMTPARLAKSYSATFEDPTLGGQVVNEQIDHMLVSPGIWNGTGPFTIAADSCQVEHDIYEVHDDANHHDHRQFRPSDHRPVSVVLEY